MKDQPNLFSAPIGIVAELMLAKEVPERAEEILSYAIHRRESQKLLVHETRQQIGWHPVHSTRTIIFSGISVFSLALTISSIASLGHWYESATHAALTIPIPLLGDKTIDFGGRMPTSTTLGLMAKLPTFGWKESLTIALGFMALVLLERLIVAAFSYRHIRALKSSEIELEQELKALRGMKPSVDQKAKSS